MLAAVVTCSAAHQPRLALVATRLAPVRRAVTVSMCDAAPPPELTIEALREQEAAQTQEMQALLQQRPLDLKEVKKLQSDIDETKAAIDVLEPAPVRYSAVGRMRQRTEGMGMPDRQKSDGEGIKLPRAESVLPPVSGLINIAITLAVVAGLALYVGGSVVS